MKEKKFSLMKKIVFSLFALILFLCCLETGVRIYKFSRHRDIYWLLFGTQYARSVDRDTMKRIHLSNKIYKNGYFLFMPGEGRMKMSGNTEIRVRINSFGLRGKEFSLNKSPGTLRIVCLGESATFGLNLDEN